MTTGKRGTIIIHAVGGAGINVANYMKKTLFNLNPEAYADIIINNVDSSYNNINKYTLGEKKESFYKIESKNFEGEEFAGGGGEKRTHGLEFIEAVSKYLDEKKITADKINELHLILFSGGGATGSTIASKIIASLLERDIAFLPITFLDKSTVYYADASLKTLQTFTGISKAQNKPLPFTFFENDSSIMTTTEAELAVNKNILMLVKTIAAFFSGRNHEIDFQDVKMLFNLNKYVTHKLPVGIYRFATVDEKVAEKLQVNAFITKSLSLSPGKHVIDPKFDLLQYKKGTTSVDITKDFPGKGTTHSMFISEPTVDKLVADLTAAANKGKEILDNVKQANIDTANVDDSGIAL